MSKRHYPIRIPRYAAGIRAQELRVGLGRSWWAKRWRTILEGLGLKGRLGRGKNYAISGQVTGMELEGNQVRAHVQGARESPYFVTLDFRVPEGAARSQIVNAIKSEPILVARLLADDLPIEIEGIFRAVGYDLFPGGRLAGGAEGRRYDVVTACTCPDYANPCKHSSAVLYILGEEIARRPFTLLELRGIRWEDLIDEN